jgi:hypothetical protein
MVDVTFSQSASFGMMDGSSASKQLHDQQRHVRDAGKRRDPDLIKDPRSKRSGQKHN